MTTVFHVVDVFAGQPFTGNQLAVVVSERAFTADKMQQIAAETNYSETTFVNPEPERDDGYRVRIFTPAREIAFAGHPLLGTAWVLRHNVLSGCPQSLQLNLTFGQVRVTFEVCEEGNEEAWFLAPSISFGEKCTAERIAVALGISPDDIDCTYPVQQFSAGTSATIVPLRSLDALRRSRLDLVAFAPLAEEGFAPLVYVFCRETYHPENHLCARFFFEAHGVREDSATGNCAAFLGAYLLEHQLFRESELSLRIEQGYEIGRPSLVKLRARKINDSHEISVGGHVIPTVRGELLSADATS